MMHDLWAGPQVALLGAPSPAGAATRERKLPKGLCVFFITSPLALRASDVGRGPEAWLAPAAAFGIWGAAEGHLGSAMRLLSCWHFSLLGLQLRLRD